MGSSCPLWQCQNELHLRPGLLLPLRAELQRGGGICHCWQLLGGFGVTQGSPCRKAIEILSRVNGSWKAGGRAFGEREPASVEGAGTAQLPGPGFLSVIPPRGAGSVPGGQQGGWCGQRVWGAPFGSSLGSAVVALWQGAACSVCAQGSCWVGKLRQVALGAAPLASMEDWRIAMGPTEGEGRGHPWSWHSWLGTPEVSPGTVSPSQKAPHPMGCFVGGDSTGSLCHPAGTSWFSGAFCPREGPVKRKVSPVW